MPRVLLATEGPSDEVVISALCVEWRACTKDDLTIKRFPARGIAQVLRLVPDIVRGAHFGYYDLLVVHADADATPDHVTGHDAPACRTCILGKAAYTTLAGLPPRDGMAPLSVAIAIPKQTTDAWLLWGRDDGDAGKLEMLDRHEVKRRVFGAAMAGHAKLARALIPALLTRIRAAEPLPPSLSRFRGSLELTR